MKKIATLLFFVVAMAFGASANTLVEQCIDVLLGKVNPDRLTAVNLDANNDGEIAIDDVTLLIDMQLQADAAKRAPAVENAEPKSILGTPPAASSRSEQSKEEAKKVE